jgi:DNA-binding GntR family transcriptional regulator
VWQGLHIETRTTITMMAPGLDLMEVAISHQPIVDAIASGDIGRACAVTREHQQFFARLPRPDQHGVVSPLASRSG